MSRDLIAAKTEIERNLNERAVRQAAFEYLSHRGENPSRVTRNGVELWEEYVPAMRAALIAYLRGDKQ